MVTISDSRRELERFLNALLPLFLSQTEGVKVQVDILENGASKHGNSAAENWRPDQGEIVISFGKAAALAQEEEVYEEELQEPEREYDFGEDDYYEPEGSVDQYRADLIRSLDRAEQRDGFEFVALKWFRDLFLPAEQYHWVDSQEARSKELRDAIDDRAVLTYKVPNPRAPEFPTTAIRVNRRHPDAVDVLGETWRSFDDYQPAEPRPRSISPYSMRQVRR